MKTRIIAVGLLWLALSVVFVSGAEPSIALSAKRQQQVTRFMNILMNDARNEIAFREVYQAYKAEAKEYQLLSFFKNAVKVNGDNVNLRIVLGCLYVSFNDLFQAAVTFQEAVRLDEEHAYAHFLLAEVYAKQGKLGEAAVEYRSAAALTGETSERIRSMLGLARVLAKDKQWGEVRTTWGEIAKLRPFDAETFRQLVEEARVFKQWDLAETWLLKLQELQKNDPFALPALLVELADVARELKQPDKAVQHYREAKTYLSESHWLHSEINARIRDCFAEKKELPLLQSQIETHLKQEPKDIAAHLELAELRGSAGVWTEAGEQMKAALALSPCDVQILERYRDVLVELKDDANVEIITKQLIALSPQNVDYTLMLADYHVTRKANDKAKALWDQIIKEHPEQPTRYVFVARAMRHAGLRDDAQAVYEKLLLVAPGITEYELEVAEFYFQRAKELAPVPANGQGAPTDEEWLKRMEAYAEKATGLVLQASQRGEPEVTKLVRSGQLLLDNLRLEAAYDLLTKSRTRFPKDLKLSEMLTETCLRLGAKQTSQAQRKFFDEALATALAAFDNCEHRVLKMGMHDELINLFLMFGQNDPRAPREKVYRLQPYVRKLYDDSLAHPNDPIPAWCLGNIQQRIPAAYFTFPDLAPKGATDNAQIPQIRTAELGQFGLHYYTKALDRDLLFVPGYYSRAEAFRLRDSFEEAVLEYKKAVVVDPANQWQYLLQMGDLFANQGQDEEAMAFWNRVAERVFTDATVFYQLACRFYGIDRKDDALRMISKAVELNPNIASFHLTLGNMYDDAEKYEQAIRQYRQALELAKQNMLLPIRERLSELQRRWAFAIFDQGRYAEALNEFEQIRAFQAVMEKHYRATNNERVLHDLSPESADVQVQMARCQEALKNQQAAAALYTNVAQEVPSNHVRINQRRTMALGYFLGFKDRGALAKPDVLTNAGTMTPRPFVLAPVQRVCLNETAREHWITPRGVLYAGLTSWLEVDPLTGKILRSLPAGKAIRYMNGVEVQVRRTAMVPGRSLQDEITMVSNDQTVKAKAQFQARIPDLQVVGNTLYCADAAGRNLNAIDPKTGNVRWKTAVSNHMVEFVAGERYLVSLDSYSDKDNTELAVYDQATGKIIQRYTLGPGIWHTPVIAQDKVFLLDDVAWQLHMYDIATGIIAYTVQFADRFPRQPVLQNKVLYLHVRGYPERTIFLYAIEPETGRILWKTDLKAMSVHSPPIFRGQDIVYLDPETQRLFMIDQATGIRHAESSSFQSLLSHRDLLDLQFMRAFGEKYILLVGGRGVIHMFAIENKK